MDGTQKRQWGITNHISEAPPAEKDLQLNDELVTTLKQRNNFETSEATENRVKVLKHLQRVAEELVRRVGKKKKLADSVIDKGGAKVFTFGSYALGVYGPKSDIDTLIVAPKFINIDDFFDNWPSILQELSDAGDIEDLKSVRDAHVPIIKMEFRNVSIDLLSASLPTVASVPQDLTLLEKGILKGLDDTGMRSVNGTRVTKELLDSVPQVKSFRHALRAIKLWSNERGIYGAVYGYPGGIAWAIMVARICQLYPYACGATIVSKFFNLMLKWKWPRPVLLKDIEEGGNLNLRVWNPAIYPGDKAHMMPVITPAFPSMCATHTIMPSTKSVMMREFERADGIMNAIALGRKKWVDLFQKHTFFTMDHKYYLSVIATSTKKEIHGVFSGLVMSKVRILAKGIDDGDDGVKTARPYVEPFERVFHCRTEEEVERVKQGDTNRQCTEDEAAAVLKAQANGEKTTDQILYTSTFYIGLTLSEEGTRSLDISYPVSQFKSMVTANPTYEEGTMALRVVHTRNYHLPDDVFSENEVKPQKSGKDKKKKKTVNSSKGAKRQFSETGLDATEQAAKRRQSENANGLPTPTPA